MIISTPSKFLIEISATPIYQRIINTFKKALLAIGHIIVLVDTTNLSSIEEYLLVIKREDPDFIISINPFSIFANYSKYLNKFIFEVVNIPIIFIHYDNIFSNLHNSSIIQKKLTSFYRMRNKSWHFCLEYENFLDLRSLGINNTFSTSHVSEFTEFSPSTAYKHEVAFLGHVLPSISDTIAGNPVSHFLQSHIWQRIAKLDTQLSVYADEFVVKQLGNLKRSIHFLSIKYF